mgnify:CR=1 FL=1
MFKVLLTFSNGETLELKEDQAILPISKYTDPDGRLTSNVDETYVLWYHPNHGFIPSATELLCNCDFFYLIDSPDKIYKTSAIDSAENIR